MKAGCARAGSRGSSKLPRQGDLRPRQRCLVLAGQRTAGCQGHQQEVYQDSNGGKWVRYDANGHMIKGWYTQDGKTWYYDLTTGAMYKGWHTIEGSTYHFDETTGVKGVNQIQM